MTTSSVTSAGTTSAAPTTTSNKALISSDFDTFLKMLTAQMQNQDPLNPMDSTDYATQLATFSGVEQQARTPVWMDGDPVTMQLTPATGADSAVLVVRDAAGEVKSREDVPAEAGLYDWLGGDAAGDPLPMGAYTLTLESYSGDTLLGET
ncbi:MAG: flagellar basal body rod modification protein, partial [Pseudomonadota bacterium]